MKVLLAFNGSDLSNAALRAVISEHRPENCEVQVLYIVPVDEWDGKGSRAQTVVERARRELREAGFKVEAEVLKGTSSYAILEAAEKWQADLIVLGWHARTALKRFLFGSIPYAVVHHAPCSVELVRAKTVGGQTDVEDNSGMESTEETSAR
jgi:nucleotide-binding universal stress UspA family protein